MLPRAQTVALISLINRVYVGMFLGGALLGAVWSPCVGPTLGGAIALAYQGENLLRATGIMIAFALGYIHDYFGAGLRRT